jgi:hypothetical protein
VHDGSPESLAGSKSESGADRSSRAGSPRGVVVATGSGHKHTSKDLFYAAFIRPQTWSLRLPVLTLLLGGELVRSCVITLAVEQLWFVLAKFGVDDFDSDTAV